MAQSQHPRERLWRRLSFLYALFFSSKKLPVTNNK
jgi:hypothetical protein